jgi:site-specific recombinase XerD
MKIDEFLATLAVRTQSADTHRAYREDLQRFEAFLRGRGLRVTQVKTSTISEYVAYLNQNAGRTNAGQLAPATIRRRLAVLSSYYEFLRAESNGKVRNPFAGYALPKPDNDLPRAVDDTTLQQLIDGITDARDKAIVMLFLYSGLRLHELCQLNVDSITVTERQLPNGQTVTLGEGEVLGKGRKRRRFVIGLEALTALSTYLQSRPSTTEAALFVSERRTRMSGRAIQHAVQTWCRRLGLAHIHVHALRHSFCTRMINAGMPSAVLRELSGHASWGAFQRYWRIRPERLFLEYHAAAEYIQQNISPHAQ